MQAPPDRGPPRIRARNAGGFQRRHSRGADRQRQAPAAGPPPTPQQSRALRIQGRAQPRLRLRGDQADRGPAGPAEGRPGPCLPDRPGGTGRGPLPGPRPRPDRTGSGVRGLPGHGDHPVGRGDRGDRPGRRRGDRVRLRRVQPRAGPAGCRGGALGLGRAEPGGVAGGGSPPGAGDGTRTAGRGQRGRLRGEFTLRDRRRVCLAGQRGGGPGTHAGTDR